MPPIWKIKDKPFWFVGTLHALRKEDYPVSATLQEAINIAELLILEDKDFVGKGKNIGIYTDGNTIQSELSPKAFSLLFKICKDMGLDFNVVQTFRPWKASALVSTKFWISLGFLIDYGLDKYLLDSFLASYGQIDGLEDSIEHLLLFDRLSSEDQENQLIKNLESIERNTSEIEGVYEAWKLGSEELVTKFIHEPLKKMPNFYQRLILDRNFTWLPKIKALINEKDSALVAVGVGHFFGESNIIDSLISAGYKIERLT